MTPCKHCQIEIDYSTTDSNKCARYRYNAEGWFDFGGAGERFLGFACCNCWKEKDGWKGYDEKACRQCKTRAAAAHKNAAEKQVRREKASNLEAWLRDMCEIDDDELPEVLDAFVDPRYRVTSTPRLFSLDAEDLDTILAPLSLGTRKLIKNAWNEMRLHWEAGGG